MASFLIILQKICLKSIPPIAIAALVIVCRFFFNNITFPFAYILYVKISPTSTAQWRDIPTSHWYLYTYDKSTLYLCQSSKLLWLYWNPAEKNLSGISSLCWIDLLLQQFVPHLNLSIIMESFPPQIHTADEFVVDIHPLALGSILV